MKLLKVVFKLLFKSVIGSGLIAKSGDKWYLRGVVSAALLNSEHNCDTKNYSAFTDAANFTQWIQGYIQTYG
jgi:hypothetical protein